MKDSTKQKITRGVLLFAALVILAVAAYTTIKLFSTNGVRLSFSPAEPNGKFSLDLVSRQNEKSFDMEQEYTDDFEKSTDGQEEKVYKSGEIEPHSVRTSPSINPLITYEKLSGSTNKILIVLILLEIALVTIAYIKLNKVLKIRV